MLFYSESVQFIHTPHNYIFHLFIFLFIYYLIFINIITGLKLFIGGNDLILFSSTFYELVEEDISNYLLSFIY